MLCLLVPARTALGGRPEGSQRPLLQRLPITLRIKPRILTLTAKLWRLPHTQQCLGLAPGSTLRDPSWRLTGLYIAPGIEVASVMRKADALPTVLSLRPLPLDLVTMLPAGPQHKVKVGPSLSLAPLLCCSLCLEAFAFLLAVSQARLTSSWVQ